MSNIQINRTLGDIVASLPKASEIFKEYRIDFCCGGGRPLSQVIKEQNINENEILSRLNEAYKEAEKFKNSKDFRKMSATTLIEFIINTHHVFTKTVLTLLNESVAKVLRAHGANHNELFRVHKLFNDLKADLEQHLIKEEEILFPLIRDYDRNPSARQLERLREVVRETESEHDAAGNILKELRRLTKDYALPGDACQTYVKTYGKLQELESDLFQHIHLENNILFKTLKLSPDDMM